jgi:Tol biopolymer transport system component
MKATCTGQPSAREAILVLKAAPAAKILADVTDPLHPKTICKLSGGWSPILVTDSEISWAASEHRPGTAGTSVIVTLDLFSGTASVVVTWQGGGYLDGVHAWSPHRDLLAYLVSNTTGVDLHLLSGGGDRVVASLGAVPGRGINVSEDDTFLQFSPDGAYFALEQTFATSGAHLQVRKATTGAVAYSQASATMATWGSTGSKLYFRHPLAGTIYAWDPVGGLTQPIGQSLAWIKPRADAGDDYLAFTVRDATGAPHVWLYGHGGRSGTQLPNIRSSPEFLTASQIFYIEEVSCGVNCGPGPATVPDGKTFIYDISHQLEVASPIMTVYTTWPRPGQI